MTALTRLRTERAKLSAVERRIADYVLENAPLIRDYSSQQLADALKVSQSSVVKFAQRLGYKGYPDLKLSITEALALHAAAGITAAAAPPSSDPDAARAEMLWRRKTAAEQETRAANQPEDVALAARLIAASNTLFVIGGSDTGQAEHSVAVRMSMLGLRCFPHGDFAALMANPATASAGDTLLVIGEPSHADCLRTIRTIRAAGGRVVVVTRSRRSSPPGGADVSLCVVVNNSEPHIEDLVYESALRQLLDDLFLRVMAQRPNAAAIFRANWARSGEASGR